MLLKNIPMAKRVLAEWGITCCADIGCIVFNLVNAGLLGKTEDDSLEDFEKDMILMMLFSHTDPLKPLEVQLLRCRVLSHLFLLSVSQLHLFFLLLSTLIDHRSFFNEIRVSLKDIEVKWQLNGIAKDVTTNLKKLKILLLFNDVPYPSENFMLSMVVIISLVMLLRDTKMQGLMY